VGFGRGTLIEFEVTVTEPAVFVEVAFTVIFLPASPETRV
jgi:hypothetical protein